MLHNNRCSLTHSQTAFANLCFRSLHSKIENRFGFKNKDGFLELVIIVPFTMIHFGFQKSNDQYIGARVIEVIIFYEIWSIYFHFPVQNFFNLCIMGNYSLMRLCIILLLHSDGIFCMFPSSILLLALIKAQGTIFPKSCSQMVIKQFPRGKNLRLNVSVNYESIKFYGLGLWIIMFYFVIPGLLKIFLICAEDGPNTTYFFYCLKLFFALFYVWSA